MEKWISYLDELSKIKQETTTCCSPEPPPDLIPTTTTRKEKVFQTIQMDKINNIGDLIHLVIKNPFCPNTEYNIQLELLHEIYPELCELDEMIGMNAVKSNVLDQILYFLQGLHKNNLLNTTETGITDYVDYKHTVLIGPPGTGKTELAKILGKLFLKLSLPNEPSGETNSKTINRPTGIFKKVTRNDLVGGYLGQTAIKTKEVIQKCLGGVLFIDEAYSLNHGGDRPDSFARECVDILCESLSFHRNNLMVIIAGYEKEMTEFLKTNEGLESRFIWRYKIEPYTPEELACIFLKMCDDQGWFVDYDRCVLNKWFSTNKEEFKSYGRDVEKLMTQVKIKHSRRLFNHQDSTDVVKKRLSIKDMDEGYSVFLKQKNTPTNEKSFALQSMYI